MDIELLKSLGVHKSWHNDPITLFTASQGWLRNVIKLLHQENLMPLCYYSNDLSCYFLLYSKYLVRFEREDHDHFVKIYDWKISSPPLIAKTKIGEESSNETIQLKEIASFIKPYIYQTKET